MIKVSVIVPVYRVEQYLRRCLDSLLQQTYEEYEIICINDCSPDNSQDILDEYAAKYQKVKCMKNSENLGQGRSRMRGIGIAQGEYIMFVDSDDYVAEDYIGRFVNELGEKEYDLIVAGYTKDTEGKLQKHVMKDSIWTLAGYPVACAKMYRKGYIISHQIDFSDIRQGEDIYFSLAAFCYPLRYKIIPYCGYYYYNNNHSTTRSLTFDMKLEKNISAMFALLLQRCPWSELSETKKRMVEYAYVTNMVNALITYGHGCKPHIMREKYQFFMRDLKKKFPDYQNNPYWGVFRPKGQTLKIRLGTGVTMMLHKIHLDSLMFWLISWI